GRKGWQIRWRETGADGKVHRHQQGGFRTKDDALVVVRDIEKRLSLGSAYRPTLTVAQLADRYLAGYTGAESTKKMLRWKLDKAAATFDSSPISELTAEEIRRWRTTIPEGHRFETTQALKQALRWAEEADLIERNPARSISNPAPTRTEIHPFASWKEVEAVAEELGEWAPLVIFAAGTGLRPGEWIALERRDLDFAGRAVNVSRRLNKDGAIVDETKNGKSRRVPLRQKVIDALDEV